MEERWYGLYIINPAKCTNIPKPGKAFSGPNKFSSFLYQISIGMGGFQGNLFLSWGLVSWLSNLLFGTKSWKIHYNTIPQY